MMTMLSTSPRQPLALVAAVMLLAGCAGDAPVAPGGDPTGSPPAAAVASTDGAAIAAIRRATARYHDLDAALADGFVFLHGCEVRPGEGAVGELYVHFGRLLDGVIDPSLPDALLYQPREDGPPMLLGAELAIPYALWTESQPPRFMGAEFQPEDEFGVWGLHVWAWNHNPEGMFAEANPNVSCAE